ncbi:unnamed protein product [Hydatigera taeniaeformis]|uniref:Uncharacterized protein n=1 Tax=Hydatigena taeniaeformis TaxID=6205 RepID=A0A0R3XB41_HYDTA|nr:unnamed protein product [Hydatigera taeniaeformis]
MGSAQRTRPFLRPYLHRCGDAVVDGDLAEKVQVDLFQMPGSMMDEEEEEEKKDEEGGLFHANRNSAQSNTSVGVSLPTPCLNNLISSTMVDARGPHTV